ncbi:MAG: hypothetical protein ACK518_01165 [bacterium]
MDTNETKQELMNMMELIDTIKDKIGDGNYLQLCNSLKKVSDKQVQSTNPHDEEVVVWGNDLDINAKYDCVVEFLEPRLILNDSCTKAYIRMISHGCGGIILTGADVSNILFDLQSLGHHNTIDDDYTGLSIQLHLELESYLLSRNESTDITKSKMFKSYTVLYISYRKVDSSTENGIRVGQG